ncbi:MAG: methyl-accepting chemotaxis protein, partial [Thermoanaerobaculia bacterium]|nr:methyl-accepting chemotaxis protein [Thermoanaerobaculia bacterium]
LSYNTAIEAERAGSGARGFQVIAGRIRQLAQLTSSATADIDRHLENVRERTRSAVGAITGVAEIIHQVRAVSEEITEALSHQVQTTEDVTRRVEVVAKESARVGHVVADLAAASRKAADRAVGTRETAAQLDAESDQLRSLIEKFRVQ